jgi:homocysteine S-methyltransferase
MTEKSKEFLQRLGEDHVFVADGAMGTLLYSRGVFINRCFDELNLSSPDLVKEVHEDYLAAGAEIIETNTYAANRFKLAPHGFRRKLRDINIAGTRIAREAAGDSAIVAGSVGPLGQPLVAPAQKNPDEVFEAFKEQIEALAEGGVDIIAIETMSDLDEVSLAVKAAKAVCDLPVIASVTYTDDKQTIYGDTPAEAVAVMENAGADVVGVNCSIGPKLVLECAEAMSRRTKRPISAMPNAGSPQLVEGRYIYLSTPEYMAEYSRRFIQRAGVQIVGGCCGTTPEHIKMIRSAVRSLRPTHKVIAVDTAQHAARKVAMEPVATEDKSAFARKLRRKFTTSVELYPPRGVDPAKVLKAAETLKEYGIDCVNIPDGPRAMARMSPMALAHLIEHHLGMETVLHYTCRDRNILGMQSDVLGCNALGLKNILAITGDPPKLGDYPDATSVFDMDSIGLVRMLHHLNCGEDLVGNEIGGQSAFHVGVGANPGAMNLEGEIERYKQKIDSGAEFVMTQPIFDVRHLENFIAETGSHRVPIMTGILPLLSHRNAEFLHNEVPGMNIPDDIRKRMADAREEDARAVGIDIAREAIAAARQLEGVAGVYIMPPFGRFKLALQVLDLV